MSSWCIGLCVITRTPRICEACCTTSLFAWKNKKANFTDKCWINITADNNIIDEQNYLGKEMTKGSRQRPYDKDKFNENFEKIFGNKRKNVNKGKKTKSK